MPIAGERDWLSQTTRRADESGTHPGNSGTSSSNTGSRHTQLSPDRHRESPATDDDPPQKLGHSSVGSPPAGTALALAWNSLLHSSRRRRRTEKFAIPASPAEGTSDEAKRRSSGVAADGKSLRMVAKATLATGPSGAERNLPGCLGDHLRRCALRAGGQPRSGAVLDATRAGSSRARPV